MNDEIVSNEKKLSVTVMEKETQKTVNSLTPNEFYNLMVALIDSGHARYLMISGGLIFALAMILRVYPFWVYPTFSLLPMEFMTMIIVASALAIAGAYFKSEANEQKAGGAAGMKTLVERGSSTKTYPSLSQISSPKDSSDENS